MTFNFTPAPQFPSTYKARGVEPKQSNAGCKLLLQGQIAAGFNNVY